MLKIPALIFALCCSLHLHISDATFFFGRKAASPFYSSPIATSIAVPAPVAPITRFAHAGGSSFKYNLPFPTAYNAFTVQAPPAPNIIKYTFGPPITTTTTTYSGYGTGAFAAHAFQPVAPQPLHATIGYSHAPPITSYVVPPQPPPPPTLPIIKYAAPSAFTAYSAAPLGISYTAAAAPVAAPAYGAW